MDVVGAAVALHDQAAAVEALVEDDEGAIAGRRLFGPAGVLDGEAFAFVGALAAEGFVGTAHAIEVIVADAAVEAVVFAVADDRVGLR